MTKMQVFTRTVYGVTKIYPANRPAEVIAKLAGQKTLTSREIALAQELGYVIEQVTDPKLLLELGKDEEHA